MIDHPILAALAVDSSALTLVRCPDCHRRTLIEGSSRAAALCDTCEGERMLKVVWLSATTLAEGAHLFQVTDNGISLCDEEVPGSELRRASGMPCLVCVQRLSDLDPDADEDSRTSGIARKLTRNQGMDNTDE